MKPSASRISELLRVADEAAMRFLVKQTGPIYEREGEFFLPLAVNGRGLSLGESELDNWQVIVEAQRELSILRESEKP